jgi:hypothetical protein
MALERMRDDLQTARKRIEQPAGTKPTGIGDRAAGQGTPHHYNLVRYSPSPSRPLPRAGL